MAPFAPLCTDLLTAKKVAWIEDLPLACGERLNQVTVGYETYGQLDEAGDNAILVCHHFSGTSHAAGRYRASDPLPGWWDAIIGPGKAIDTERWFVVAIDALGCVRIDPPHGVTTNPASINPQTGKPYGPEFPPLAVQDSVLAQRLVLNHLGVGRLAAVVGPSFGTMQALEWAVSRPAEVDRVIAAIGPAELQAREIGVYSIMRDVIRMDPLFHDGRYAPEAPPLRGLAASIKLMMLLAGGREDLQETWGRQRVLEGDWAVAEWLDAEALKRARLCDANSWIAMLETNQRSSVAHGEPLEAALARITARVMLIPASGDELTSAAHYHAPLDRALAGSDHAVFMLPPRHGHMAGLLDIGLAGEPIRRFLET